MSTTATLFTRITPKQRAAIFAAGIAALCLASVIYWLAHIGLLGVVVTVGAWA